MQLALAGDADRKEDTRMLERQLCSQLTGRVAQQQPPSERAYTIPCRYRGVAASMPATVRTALGLQASEAVQGETGAKAR